MDFPDSFVGGTAEEGEIYYFAKNCPVGIAEHMHVCIKHASKIIFLSTCSSQIDTAKRMVKYRSDLSMDVYPVFTPDDENKFTKETYINCNQVVELSDEEFGKLVKEKKIRLDKGIIGKEGLSKIAAGIKCSPDIERKIKKLF